MTPTALPAHEPEQPGDAPAAPARTLVRAHRLIGYVVGHITLDGVDHVIIHTQPHRYEVAPAHLAQPADADAALMDIRLALADAVALARWRGIDPATVLAALTAIIAQPE